MRLIIKLVAAFVLLVTVNGAMAHPVVLPTTRTMPAIAETALESFGVTSTGETIRGVFLEVQGDGVVIATAGGVVYQVPLTELDAASQARVRAHLAAAADKPTSAPASTDEQEVVALTLGGSFVLGFEHIIPEGLDHCLFVLGLFLLTPSLRGILIQISTFTLAHTLTLSLTALGVVGLPESVVEPLIALSIAFIAVENMVLSKPWAFRPVVTFVFGLVHGMGVAGAFLDAKFLPGELLPSLGMFTLGVEAGHLAVLAGAFAVLGWARGKPWYARRVAVPLSGLIAVVAVYWVVERLGWLGGA